MRILLADDHAIVRQGLKSLIQGQSGMEVVGEAEDGQAAVHLAEELSPDVIIMDVTMPGLNGIEATRRILQKNPDVKVIVLSMHPDKHFVRDSLKVGAVGYVLKSNLLDEVHRALQAVAAGNHYLSPRVANIMIEDYVRGSTQRKASRSNNPTGDERQILQLVAEGLTVKQIAQRLHISPKTADAKRRTIMNKLGLSNIADLVKYAIREGLTSIDF